ncbi:MAG: IS21-like element helper ATPase IstB [Myxococcales bacterium]|nr:IS21-like element helper ATPase IstB [Myxococcales bacterium]
MPSNLAQRLETLGLRAVAGQFDDFIGFMTQKQRSPAEILEAIVALECADRSQRSLERRQKRSRIGTFKPITDFDWQWPKELDRARIEAAVKLSFLQEGANLVLVGPHGLGKTMLLKNIAHQAVLQGHSVYFTSASRLLAELSSFDSPSLLHKRITFYTSFRLLCIDELGYLSYDQRGADLLFEVVSRRYDAQRSIALSTNLPFKEWTTVFPHAACTVALVDRLTHRAEIIRILGESWRRKEARERNDPE